MLTNGSDTGRTSSSDATSTQTPTFSSSTSLSQDTAQILSSWHRFKRRRDVLERRSASPGNRHPAYGASPTATSRRDAAERYLSAFPCPAEQPTQERTLSSSCDCGRREADSASAPGVSLGWGLCYALLVLLTAVFAISTGVVLVRLIPAAAATPPRGGVHGAALQDEVPRPSTVPSPKPKTLNHAAAHTIHAGVLPTAPSVTNDDLPAGGTSRTNSVDDDSIEKVNASAFKDGVTASVLERTQTGREDLEQKRHLCGRVFYTYCTRPQPEFYFNRAVGSCTRATTAYGGEVCNRSPNRFASRAICMRTCVDARRPSGRCLDRPVFSQCGSADLKMRLWFFEGEACGPWDFPSGKCPMEDGDLFESRDACAKKCSGNGKFVPLCQTPSSGVCTARHLRFPYFAAKLPGEKIMRCLSTSALSLHKHICLTGTNRFPTSASCRRACGREDRSNHQE